MKLKDVSHDWKPEIQIQKLFISAKLKCFCILLHAFFPEIYCFKYKSCL